MHLFHCNFLTPGSILKLHYFWKILFSYHVSIYRLVLSFNVLSVFRVLLFFFIYFSLTGVHTPNVNIVAYPLLGADREISDYKYIQTTKEEL
jgi:hypothetical protein